MYLQEENVIWVGQDTGMSGTEGQVLLRLERVNRHGIITGATGTGKTTTMKTLAEGLSDAGVPVFLCDIKGDVSGMCVPGEPGSFVEKSVASLHIEDWSYDSYPVQFWDVFARNGIAVRTAVSNMGPDLLSRLLNLNDVQTQVLTVLFKIADDKGWLLVDIKDLKAMLQYAGNNSKELSLAYGNLAPQSIAAIQRSLVRLESIGGDIFFGEPDLDINDWMTFDEKGRGVINILSSVELVKNPLLYSTFLLWMLSDLYEKLPEVGDVHKPKIAFFFDEAHLLFSDTPKALLHKIEQVARLIRSKGVGIFFVSQSPSDIPDTVLAQLGNKFQHALRAYTPSEQRAVKAAAMSFRANEAFDTAQVISELGIGEALVSVLDAGGTPSIVQRARILPIRSFDGMASDERIQKSILESAFHAKYATAIDRESAYEVLTEQAEEDSREEEQRRQNELEEKERKRQGELEEKERKRQDALDEKEAERKRKKETRSREGQKTPS